MDRLDVTRGNCPCVAKPAREAGGRTDCGLDPAACQALFDALPPAEPAAASPIPTVPDVVRFDPSSLSTLYSGDFGDFLLLVTAPRIRRSLRLEPPQGFRLEEMTWHGDETRQELIAALAELQRSGGRCSVLWIAETEFEHYLPEHLAGAKLAAITFFSGHFTRRNLTRYLQILATVDYSNELALEQRMLTEFDGARRILFRSPELGTTATFQHHAARHWFSLHGPLDWGQQTVLPTGELSTLTDPSGEFTLTERFRLDGELVLMGQPVVHRGNNQVTQEETDEMYGLLSPMQALPIVAVVRDGVIQEIRSPLDDNPLTATFGALFEHDERYRKVHEIGFGTNVSVRRMEPGNFFPNERWPGLHCGLGLGGFTPFHLDLTCTAMDVLVETDDGRIVDLYEELGLPRDRRIGHQRIATS